MPKHNMTFVRDDVFMCIQCGAYMNMNDLVLRPATPCKACEVCLMTHAPGECLVCGICKDHAANITHTDPEDL